MSSRLQSRRLQSASHACPINPIVPHRTHLQCMTVCRIGVVLRVSLALERGVAGAIGTFMEAVSRRVLHVAVYASWSFLTRLFFSHLGRLMAENIGR